LSVYQFEVIQSAGHPSDGARGSHIKGPARRSDA
jgi:hypothetical protein